MKKELLFLITFLTFQIGISQTFSGDATLTTQAEVNSFGSNNYTTITGKLTIDSNGNSITDLSPLSTLQTVGSTNSGTGLTISNNSSLTSLNGLDNVTDIFGPLIIDNNSQLSSLSGLNSLQNVNYDTGVFGGNFEITNNNNLNDINGLTSLNYIASNTEIVNNANLNSISILSNVNYTNEVTIEGNPSLTSLNGLKINNTTRLFIIDNDGITTFQGLNLSGTIQRELVVRDNDNIVNFQGFENVSFTAFFPMMELTVADNNQLNSLTGLNLAGIIDIDIDNNNLLSDISLLSNYNSGLLRIANSNSISSLSPLSNYTGGTIITIEGTNGFTNLTGLENVTTLSRLNIINTNLTDLSQLPLPSQLCSLIVEGNQSLSNISNFSQITKIGCDNSSSFYIINNNIQNLDVFNNVTEITVAQMRIWDNSNLNDFCGISSVFQNNNFSGLYWVTNNLYNPSETEIANGSTCSTLSNPNYTITEIKIYPNPATDVVNLNSEIPIKEITIFDLAE